MTNTDSPVAGRANSAYEAPTITRLGTLGELTLGKIAGTSDGFGGSFD